MNHGFFEVLQDNQPTDGLVIQAIWSPIWLRHYLYGPAEWLWRSLTYWQRQPLTAPQPVTVPMT